MLGEKEKQKQEVRARVNVQTEAHWLVDFFYWNCDSTRAWQAVMSNELLQYPIDQNSKIKRVLLVYILPTALFENYAKNRF